MKWKSKISQSASYGTNAKTWLKVCPREECLTYNKPENCEWVYTTNDALTHPLWLGFAHSIHLAFGFPVIVPCLRKKRSKYRFAIWILPKIISRFAVRTSSSMVVEKNSGKRSFIKDAWKPQNVQITTHFRCHGFRFLTVESTNQGD